MNQNAPFRAAVATEDPSVRQNHPVQTLAVAYIPAGDAPSAQAARHRCREQAEKLGLTIAYEYVANTGEFKDGLLAVLDLYRFNTTAPNDDTPMPVGPLSEGIAYEQRGQLLPVLGKTVALAARVADDEARGAVKGVAFFGTRRSDETRPNTSESR